MVMRRLKMEISYLWNWCATFKDCRARDLANEVNSKFRWWVSRTVAFGGLSRLIESFMTWRTSRSSGLWRWLASHCGCWRLVSAAHWCWPPVSADQPCLVWFGGTRSRKLRRAENHLHFSPSLLANWAFVFAVVIASGVAKHPIRVNFPSLINTPRTFRSSQYCQKSPARSMMLPF